MNLSEVSDDDIIREYRSRIQRINADKKKKDVISFANMLIQKVNENPDNVSASLIHTPSRVFSMTWSLLL